MYHYGLSTLSVELDVCYRYQLSRKYRKTYLYFNKTGNSYLFIFGVYFEHYISLFFIPTVY